MRLPPTNIVPPQWQVWDIAPGVSLDVLLGPPTFADRFSPVEAIRSRVKDWRGVEDDQGEPVGYSFEALDRVISLHPDAMSQLQSLVQPDHSARETNPDRSEPPVPHDRSTSTQESVPNPPPQSAQLPVTPPSALIHGASLPHAAVNPQLTSETPHMRPVAVVSAESPAMETPLDTAAAPTQQTLLTDESLASVSPNVTPPVTTTGDDTPLVTDHVQAQVTDKSVRSAMPPATADSTPEYARQLHQATNQLSDQQQHMQQSLDEAWRVLNHLAGRGGNASQRAQLSGGGR